MTKDILENIYKPYTDTLFQSLKTWFETQWNIPLWRGFLCMLSRCLTQINLTLGSKTMKQPDSVLKAHQLFDLSLIYPQPHAQWVKVKA